MWWLLRSASLLVATLTLIGGAQAQSFDQYTVIPSVSCCAGTFSGSPQGTDTITLTRQTFVPNVGNIGVTANLPLSSFASAADVQSLNARIDQAMQQFQQMNNSISQVERGVAASVALANTFMPSAPGRTSWAMNAATFDGKVGVGFSIAHRLDLSFPIAVTAGYANGDGTTHIGRIGLMGEF